MIDHPGFGPWVDGPMPQGCPWGLRQQNDTNPYNEKNVPNTGMTRYYEWEISNITMAPDGVELPLLVANGQFPGPLIEANWVRKNPQVMYNAVTNSFRVIGLRSRSQTISTRAPPCIGMDSSRKVLRGMTELLA